MARRDFRTPPTLPTETYQRCITIPASQPWLGLVNAALLMLTEAWRYEQVEDTDLTADETAAAAYAMYVAYLGECDMSCCPLRWNPNTGRFEQSDDDGLTWFDVDDGPWVDPLVDGSIYWPDPKVRTAGDDDEQKCAAAWAAANVLQSLYQQTWGAFVNWAVGGAIAVAQTLARGAEIAAGVTVGSSLIGTAQALYEETDQFTDGGFPDTELETVQNILFCNATVTDGQVTFNLSGVTADFAAEGTDPYGGLNFLLSLYLGEEGLNAAGNVQFGDGDCSEAPCGGPCTPAEIAIEYPYDDGNFTLNTGTINHTLDRLEGTYSSGGGQNAYTLRMTITFDTPVYIDWIDIHGSSGGGGWYFERKVFDGDDNELYTDTDLGAGAYDERLTFAAGPLSEIVIQLKSAHWEYTSSHMVMTYAVINTVCPE